MPIYDIEPDPTDYRDTPEFRTFAQSVWGCLTKRPKTIREIKENLRDRNNEHWLWNALDCLMAMGMAAKIEVTPQITRFRRGDGLTDLSKADFNGRHYGTEDRI